MSKTKRTNDGRRYEVWALGTCENNFDAEELLGVFTNSKDAIKHAKRFDSIGQIYDPEIVDTYLMKNDTMEVRVETVVDTDDGSRNINTVYSQEITYLEA